MEQNSKYPAETLTLEPVIPCDKHKWGFLACLQEDCGGRIPIGWRRFGLSRDGDRLDSDAVRKVIRQTSKAAPYSHSFAFFGFSGLPRQIHRNCTPLIFVVYLAANYFKSFITMEKEIIF